MTHSEPLPSVDMLNDAELIREGWRLLELVVAEWQSDPMAVQCFDLGIVERATAAVRIWRYREEHGTDTVNRPGMGHHQGNEERIIRRAQSEVAKLEPEPPTRDELLDALESAAKSIRTDYECWHEGATTRDGEFMDDADRNENARAVEEIDRYFDLLKRAGQEV